MEDPTEESPLIDSSSLRRDESPKHARQRHLGVASVGFLIFNRIIGTGIFAAPSIILRCAGSIGATFTMWVIGTLVAAAGTSVYIELGTALPRNGGEKNYLEFIYNKPRFMITCAYASYAIFTGWASANSLVFGEYLVNALSITATRTTIGAAALLCMTFCLVMHGCFLHQGLRIQNTLGAAKIVILIVIPISALLNVVGIPFFQLRDGVNVPHNFDVDKIWEGSFKTGVSGFVTGMFNVIWSYNGYQNANYALAEVHNPVRTIRRAAPLAVAGVSVFYFLINIAYFIAIAKEDILESRRIVAALFFRNIFGPSTEKILSGAIALSTLGNVMSIVFAHGRVIQELGREGILPASRWFGSSKPFDSPLRGILVVWLVSSVLMLSAPSGDAYLLMVNLSYYPIILFNVLLPAGIIYMHISPSIEWNPPYRSYTAVAVFFFISNVFLLLAPFVPPPPGFQVYENFPYWLHVVGALIIGLLGVSYFTGRWVILPKIGKYELRRVTIVEHGIPVAAFRKQRIE
ncbi:APC amino acid permease [Punctularia strigosozonata HHB-11173 SS5]|uniref:APC amino acid permease n=1 Tax=Punctularia strigosozonata (strain HHB-11173) TaxID=741275 RepID=R7S0B5_PUNST|nr:APC amino acid permease [Punctularia strigosozonata HHB-11173 SS5]EIN03825.1 APC amino acid permease [Punctularia strigosozonata HHB-11173 SS5]